MRRRIRLLGSLILILLTACVGYQQRYADFHQALRQGEAELALKQLQDATPGRDDQILHQMHIALLLHYQGEYAASNQNLEQVKQQISRYAATSVTEQIAAVTINETNSIYLGRAYEQVLVYFYKMINYMALNDFASARVEALQLDVFLQQQPAVIDQVAAQAIGMTRYISAVIFEQQREWDSALVAYRQAYHAYQQAEFVPQAVIGGLLRLTQYFALQAEHNEIQQRYPETEWLSVTQLQTAAHWLLLLQPESVTAMRAEWLSIYSPEARQLIYIELPYYSAQAKPVKLNSLDTSGVQTELLADIEQLARADLNMRLPTIRLRAIARAVAKYQLTAQAQQEDEWAGALAQIFTVVSEQADTRSWSSLPANIQLLSLTLPIGRYTLQHGEKTIILNLLAGQTTLTNIYCWHNSCEQALQLIPLPISSNRKENL